ncbi:MAG TPA: class I SAM-dependent methyltransferase [Polyangia bacterium]|jgi:SAM-dependent methyltransferase|nr:class I SAM-dependent methyltransferase [Polyangia bacterium]
MSLGRRKIGIEEEAAWVFNRIAEVYDARPCYPPALIDALADLAGPAAARIGDLGAGIGHLALPLCERGFDVVAIEPARAMLERLRATAADRGLTLRTVHAAAELLPLETASLDLVVIADALHFMDAQLTGGEVKRVLAPGGRMVIVICEPAQTPFMRDVVRTIEQAVPRRPRDLTQTIRHLSAVAGVPLTSGQRFDDETPMDHQRLERLLRSISFIGPAMNPARFAAFRHRVHALCAAPVWARSFFLRSGRRRTPAPPRTRGEPPTRTRSPGPNLSLLEAQLPGHLPGVPTQVW